MGISTTIMAASAVVGAGTAGYGLYQQQQGYSAAQSASQQQAQIAGQQAALSAEYAGKEADINIAASDASYAASSQSHDINRAILSNEMNVEGQRRLAMEAVGRRDLLEIERARQRARSAGLTAATASGSRMGSGLQGGYGQVSGQSNTNARGVQTNLDIGRSIFDLNASTTQERVKMSDLELSYAKQQADLTTQKSRLVADYAARGATLTTAMAQAGGSLATAQGQVGFGGSLMQAGGAIFSAGQSFSKIAPSFFPQTGAPTSLTPALYGGTYGPSSGGMSMTQNMSIPPISSSWGLQ